MNNLPTTEETANLLKLQIPNGKNSSFLGLSPSIDSSTHRNNLEDSGLASAGNVEISKELNSSLSGDVMEFVENYFRLRKAQKSWKKLSIAVKISMMKWQL